MEWDEVRGVELGHPEYKVDSRHEAVWCVVCAPEESGPVDGVEGEEDDGEGHPRQPLYVAVPHPAQGRGGAGLHLPGRAGGGQEVAPPPHLPGRASNKDFTI